MNNHFLILPRTFSAKLKRNLSDSLGEVENNVMGKIQPTLIIPQQQGAIKPQPQIMDSKITQTQNFSHERQ